MHTTAAKQVLRFLKTTSDLRIHYCRLSLSSHNANISIVGYTDSDWAGNLTTGKSVRGCLFGLCTNGSERSMMSGLVHCQAKSQSVVALSTLEAEYIAASHATWENLWLKRMLKEAADRMGVMACNQAVPIGCDNQGAIKLIASGVVHQKSKHIDVKYHHVHDEQMKGLLKFQYVTSESNPADLLSKSLAALHHEQLVRLIGLAPHVPHPDSHTEITI